MNKDIFKLAKKIKTQIKKGDVENYHTGLVGEQIIVASYQTMPTEKLEKMRFIINKIIKKRKIALKVKASEVREKEDKKESDNSSSYRDARKW